MTKSTCPCGATLELPVTYDSFTRGEYTVRLKLWTDAHAACLAARNALPPAPTPSPVDDGPPEPLPEVLPVGTRMHDAAPLEGEGRLADNRRVYVVKVPGGSSSFHHSRVDWADYRRTHSPPPNREGICGGCLGCCDVCEGDALEGCDACGGTGNWTDQQRIKADKTNAHGGGKEGCD